MESWLGRAWKGHPLSLFETARVLHAARELLLQEPNVVELKPPIVIVGDIHGQFFDLLQMFDKVGRPPEQQFLFLGDFVDRGSYSVETITLLLLLKVIYPDKVTLLRGNHESRQPTRTYGFYQECLTKYNALAEFEPVPEEFNPVHCVPTSPNAKETVGSAVWSSFMSVFDCLPIAALVGTRVLAVHGGLSPSLLTIDSIRAIHRFRDVPEEGPMADLLWSDPQNDNGWSKNSRGVGWVFGPDVIRKFLATNNLSFVVRSHQMVMEGIQEVADGRLLTVWSAPNYTGRLVNLATVLKLSELYEGEVIYFDNAPAYVHLQHQMEVQQLQQEARSAASVHAAICSPNSVEKLSEGALNAEGHAEQGLDAEQGSGSEAESHGGSDINPSALSTPSTTASTATTVVSSLALPGSVADKYFDFE